MPTPPAPTATTTPRRAGWHDGPSDGVHDARGCARCRRSPGWFRPDSGRPSVTSPEQAAAVLVPQLDGADREQCVAALLDTRHQLLDTVVVSVGSIDHTFMAPREIYRDALVANASAVVLAHNHPSGDPEPSRDDDAVTRRLAAAGELMGIDLLDHLVVAAGRWISLARRGVC